MLFTINSRIVELFQRLSLLNTKIFKQDAARTNLCWRFTWFLSSYLLSVAIISLEFDNDRFLAELALVILSFVKYPIIDDFVGERFDLYTVRHNVFTLHLQYYPEQFNWSKRCCNFQQRVRRCDANHARLLWMGQPRQCYRYCALIFWPLTSPL